MIQSILSAVVTLGVVVLILFLAYYCTRFIGRMGIARGNTKYMKIIDRMNLSQDKSIAIVQIGEKYILTGVSSAGISLLKELSEEDLVQLNNDMDSPQEVLDFKTVIDKIRKRDTKR